MNENGIINGYLIKATEGKELSFSKVQFSDLQSIYGLLDCECIHGSVLCFGSPDNEGIETDISDEQIEFLTNNYNSKHHIFDFRYMC